MPLSFMNMPLLYAHEITVPVLILMGEKAHSRYFAEDAFKAVGSKDKELVVVPGANRTGGEKYFANYATQKNTRRLYQQ